MSPHQSNELFTVVKTLDAVDQDKQGIRGIGFGQLVTAREAICNNRHQPTSGTFIESETSIIEKAS